MSNASRRLAVSRSMNNSEMPKYPEIMQSGYYDDRRSPKKMSRKMDRHYDEDEYEMNDGRRSAKRSVRSRYYPIRVDKGYPMYDRGSMPFGVAGTIVYDDKYEEYCMPEYANDYGRHPMEYDRHYPEYYRRNDYNYGHNYDYGYDYAYDYDDDMKLTKREMQEWKQKMVNADGTRGEHFTMERILPVAQQLGIRFDEYSEKELCMVVNMLYSDNSNVTKKYISPDKELMYYVEEAKAWLEDEDAPEGSEKLARYYKYVVNGEM